MVFEQVTRGPANFQDLFVMLEQERIEPQIAATFELEDYAAALDLILSRRAQGKVLLQVSHSR